MRAARRWLLANPEKVPFYINGQKRQGELDGPNDLVQLVSYHEAKAALAARGDGWLLGFALGPDGSGGHWQGIDFDKVEANRLGDLANAVPGYVEMSPSGAGAHAIGYGQHFVTLGSNGSGIEAYAGGRYFTVTERPIRDGGPVCLAGFVAQALAPRHGAGRAALASVNGVEAVPVDAKTVTELRSALGFLRSEDRDQWIAVGHALKELGEVGRSLWLDWSRSSDKFDPANDPKKWDSFDPTRTGYQAVFKRAQEQGWVNPASTAAQLAPAPIVTEESGAALLQRLSVDWSDDSDVEVPDVIAGLVADEEVTLLGGHGGAGKSFLALQMACAVALGEEVLYRPTSQSRVLYYSAEDGRKRLTRRLRNMAELFDYDAERLKANLRVVDASELEPLYGETIEQSRFAKLLGPRADFANLQKMVEAFDPQLVIIDGGSDTFDGNEIARREVRAFIKLLRRIHPRRNIAVLLLVHIDRSSARGHSTNDDGYAGSAQWHNSCRRRMFLQVKAEKDDDGEVVSETFLLRVMKNQDGPPDPDMELIRTQHGLWQIAATFGGNFAQKDESDRGATLLRLIAEHYERGTYMSTSLAPQASTGVYATLKDAPGFPRGLTRKRVEALVRQLERDCLLVKEDYKRGNRAMGERWAVARGAGDAN
jgi:RecA-family ATPase